MCVRRKVDVKVAATMIRSAKYYYVVSGWNRKFSALFVNKMLVNERVKEFRRIFVKVKSAVR